MQGESCTIINRTSTPLTVKMNGRVRVLEPGPNQLTTEWIRFAKLQNPRMGTFDASGLEGEYLVGVKGTKDDCSMIPPGEIGAAVERFDRTKMDDAEAASAVPMATGVPPPRRRVPSDMSPVPQDASFGGER